MSALEKNPVKHIIEGDFMSRVHSLDPGACSFDVVTEVVQGWRTDGRFSVFNAGTYDILTINHILGLVQCRTIGAAALLGVESIGSEQELEAVHSLAASRSVALVVSLDTNAAIEEGKSRRTEKGGAPKPILDWDTRAAMVASQSVPIPGYSSRVAAVDYITRHGPDCCASCEPGSCINEDNALMTIGMQPNMVVVNSESARTVSDLYQYSEMRLLPHTQIVLVVEADNQYSDRVLGAAIKTTTIIERARS